MTFALPTANIYNSSSASSHNKTIMKTTIYVWDEDDTPRPVAQVFRC